MVGTIRSCKGPVGQPHADRRQRSPATDPEEVVREYSEIRKKHHVGTATRNAQGLPVSLTGAAECGIQQGAALGGGVDLLLCASETSWRGAFACKRGATT